MWQSMSPDKTRYALESCLLSVLKHRDGLQQQLLRNTALDLRRLIGTLLQVIVLPTIGPSIQVSRPPPHTHSDCLIMNPQYIFHSSPPFYCIAQVLSIGVLGFLFKLWYAGNSIRPDSGAISSTVSSSPSECWLAELICLLYSHRHPPIGAGSVMEKSRTTLSFWAVIRRIVQLNLTDHFLSDCLRLMEYMLVVKSHPVLSRGCDRTLYPLLLVVDALLLESRGSVDGGEDVPLFLANISELLRINQCGRSVHVGRQGLLRQACNRPELYRTVDRKWTSSPFRSRKLTRYYMDLWRYESCRARLYRGHLRDVSEHLKTFTGILSFVVCKPSHVCHLLSRWWWWWWSLLRCSTLP